MAAASASGPISRTTCAAAASRAGAYPCPTGSPSAWCGWHMPPCSGPPVRCQHPHPAAVRVAAQTAPLREPEAAGNTGMDSTARLPAVRGADLWSSDAQRSRALGSRRLGRLEQPLQPKKPLLEELVAQVGQPERDGRA